MSSRGTTVPPTRVCSRSSRNGRSGLIAREKDEKQSAKERSALDNRFHRTDLTLTCEPPPRASGTAARRLQRAARQRRNEASRPA